MGRARLDRSMYRRLCDITAEDLAKIQLLHPLHGVEGGAGEWDDIRDFRAADFVTDTEGTGFVHCAPSHGMEEFELYRDLGMLEQVITYNVMEDGRFRADLPFFGGKAILKPNGKEGNANEAIIDKLAEVGGLLARCKIKHSYPHSWRSKAPVIYRNTPQWFAAVDKPVNDGQDTYGKTIRARALTSIDELVTWTPPTGRNRLYPMIEARPDWVLSRQRAWGVPLTCFTKNGSLPTDDDYLLRNEEVNARILEALRPRVRMPGIKRVQKSASWAVSWHLKTSRRCSTSWTFGLTADPRMHLYCATGPMGPTMVWPISILRAQTSIADGSIPQCCNLVAPRAARPIGAC